MTDSELNSLKEKVENEEAARLAANPLLKLETQAEIVSYCQDAFNQLYNNINSAYSRLDMKMGLISGGTMAVLAQLVPLLQKLKEKK